MLSEEVLHHTFKCTLCGTSIKLPLCCKTGTFKAVEGQIICELCGTKETIPICCDMRANYAGVE